MADGFNCPSVSAAIAILFANVRAVLAFSRVRNRGRLRRTTSLSPSTRSTWFFPRISSLPVPNAIRPSARGSLRQPVTRSSIHTSTISPAISGCTPELFQGCPQQCNSMQRAQIIGV